MVSPNIEFDAETGAIYFMHRGKRNIAGFMEQLPDKMWYFRTAEFLVEPGDGGDRIPTAARDVLLPVSQGVCTEGAAREYAHKLLNANLADVVYSYNSKLDVVMVGFTKISKDFKIGRMGKWHEHEFQQPIGQIEDPQ